MKFEDNLAHATNNRRSKWATALGQKPRYVPIKVDGHVCQNKRVRRKTWLSSLDHSLRRPLKLSLSPLETNRIKATLSSLPPILKKERDPRSPPVTVAVTDATRAPTSISIAPVVSLFFTEETQANIRELGASFLEGRNLP